MSVKVKNDEIKDKQEEQIEELSGKLGKLREMAKKYGIDLNTYTESQNKFKALEE
jgi:DNA-binding protein H-NS